MKPLSRGHGCVVLALFWVGCGRPQQPGNRPSDAAPAAEVPSQGDGSAAGFDAKVGQGTDVRLGAEGGSGAVVRPDAGSVAVAEVGVSPADAPVAPRPSDAAVVPAGSVWQSWNPGGGGAIQGIAYHRGVAGRLYLCSDMEGCYRSDDDGQTFRFLGGALPHGFNFTIVGERGNAGRLYNGSLLGLSLSDDGGDTWRLVGAPLGKPMAIATIAVDPADINHIYAAPGWLGRTEFLLGETVTGARLLFQSRDRGAHWESLAFAPGNGAREVYSLTADHQNHRVFVASAAGLFAVDDSGSSHAVAGPGGGGACFGADLSPDGTWIYAAFASGSGTRIFASRTDTVAWTDVSSGLGKAGSFHYWRPTVDPRSDATTHRVLVGPLFPNENGEGLSEGTFTVQGQQVQGQFRTIFTDSFSDRSFMYDPGWNNLRASARLFAYQPDPAHGRPILVVTQQSLFRIDPTGAQSDWTCLSSRRIPGGDGQWQYSQRGFASTFDFDVAGRGQYVIQGQADNGVLESWDGGRSWSQTGGADPRTAAHAPSYAVSVSEAVAIAETTPPIVLAGMSANYGAGSVDSDGFLYAKEIKAGTTADAWRLVGSNDDRLGLPHKRMWTIASSPRLPARVYVGTQTGLFMADDMAAVLHAGGRFRDIGAGGPSGAISAVFADPNNDAVVFVHGDDGLWSGNRRADGVYTWTRLDGDRAPGSGWSGLAVWADGATTRLALPRNGQVAVGTGQGSFQPVLTVDQALAAHREPWYEPGVELSFGGLVGDGTHLFVSVFSGTGGTGRARQHGQGMLMGTRGTQGQWTWQDWSGSGVNALPFSNARHGRRLTVGGVGYIALPTVGAGLWARPLP